MIRAVEKDTKKKFRLRVKPVGAAVMKHRGVYYPDANVIILDLWKKDGRTFIHVNEILKTLAHELAHAKTRWEVPVHGPGWKRSYKEIWAYVRKKFL